MKYNFRLAQEVVWAMLVAFVVYAGTAFITDMGVTDWRAWGIATLAGAARAAVAVLVAALTKSAITPS